MKKENRGGRRPGAGRPRLDKRQEYDHIVVHRDTFELIRSTKKDVTWNDYIMLLLNNYLTTNQK